MGPVRADLTPARNHFPADVASTTTGRDETATTRPRAARIQRFGVYATDEIALTPEPFNAHLGIGLAAAS